MTTPTKHERRRAADIALAHQRLEGLEPDAGVVADMERVITGEMDVAKVIADFVERAKRGEVRG